MTCSADVFITSQMFSWPLDLGRGCIIWGWVTWREVVWCEKRLADLRTQVCGHLFVLHEMLIPAMKRTLQFIKSFWWHPPLPVSIKGIPMQSPVIFQWMLQHRPKHLHRLQDGVWSWGGGEESEGAGGEDGQVEQGRDFFLWLFHYRYIINRWIIVYFHLYLLVTSIFWQWFVAGLTLVRIYQYQVSGEPTSVLVRWRNFSLRILLLWSLSIKNPENDLQSIESPRQLILLGAWWE